MADYDLRYHRVEVTSKSKLIFDKLTPSIMNLVENDYYKQIKDLKINELHQKISVLNKNLQQIDTLRNTYREIALKEAEKLSGSSTIEISKSDNNKNKNDIELFKTSNEILNTISGTNTDLIRKNHIVNIISDFDKIGVPDKNITHKKYFQYAILFFGLMLGWILLGQVNKYLNNY